MLLETAFVLTMENQNNTTGKDFPAAFLLAGLFVFASFTVRVDFLFLCVAMEVGFYLF